MNAKLRENNKLKSPYSYASGKGDIESVFDKQVDNTTRMCTPDAQHLTEEMLDRFQGKEPGSSYFEIATEETSWIIFISIVIEIDDKNIGDENH